jgi:hypothetical protein
MLTATGTARRPASSQQRVCRQASRSTQRPIGTISPHSSAIGTNCSGQMMPEFRIQPAHQRLGAVIAPEARSICGW